MKARRNLISIWLFCAAILPAVAQAQFIFTTNNDGSLNLYQYTGSGGDVIIPGTTNGLPVTSIGDYAFAAEDITSVTIPNSVTGIGNWSFDSCTSLASLTIPDSVTSIGEYAFDYCVSLTNITVPNSVTSIGTGAFQYCTGLTSMAIPDSVTSIGDEAFSYCPNLNSVTIPDSITSIGNAAFYDSGLDSVTIPDSVTNIGSYAFEYCGNLVGVTISGNVTSIGTGAFQYCTSLTSVAIPDGVTSIGDEAFEYCSSLDNVTFGNGVTNIGSYAFSYCSSLASVTIPTNITSISRNTFSSCTSLTSVTIPNSVINIGNYAFAYCGLTNLMLTTNVTSIGTGVFSNCVNLASVTIPNGVISIGTNAFNTCTGLTSITIPDSITRIGTSAFQNCTYLVNVTLGNSVTNIGSYAFSHCGRLFHVFSRGNTPIPTNDSSVFVTDSSATIYYLPGATGWGTTFDGRPTMPCFLQTPYICTTNPVAVTIVAYTGSGGTALIPGTINGLPVNSIGSYSFLDCYSLTNLVVPGSVTSIGSYAFESCIELTTVYFDGNAPMPANDKTVFTNDNIATVYYFSGTTGWGTTFDYRPALQVPFNFTTNNGLIIITGYTSSGGAVTIPSTINGFPVTLIGIGAFNGSSITSVTIPNSVRAIAGSSYGIPFGDVYGAFAGCTSLTNVIIGNSVANIGGTAFEYCTSLTSLTIPSSVTNIGEYAFANCTSLTNISIGSGVTYIGQSAFAGCNSLNAITVDTNNSAFSSVAGGLFDKNQTTLIQYPAGNAHNSYTIPNTVTSIGLDAFDDCANLANVTIPASVTYIGFQAFADCTSLTTIYFTGNAPHLVSGGGPGGQFDGDTASVYYLPWTTGWSTSFGGLTAVPWLPQAQTCDAAFGVQTNQFGFNINWASGQTVVVEASTDLISWQPVGTNTITGGSSYFSDPQWTNYPGRFYRLRSP